MRSAALLTQKFLACMTYIFGSRGQEQGIPPHLYGKIQSVESGLWLEAVSLIFFIMLCATTVPTIFSVIGS